MLISDKKWISIVWVVILLITAFLSRSIWFDEAYSIIYSAASVNFILGVHDVQPYGHYLLLHFWELISNGAVFIRFLSVIAGLISFYFIYKIVSLKYRNPDRKSLYDGFFVFLVFVMIFCTSLFHYFTEIRPYAFGLAACLASFYFLLRYKEDRRNSSLIWFIITTASLPYFHYFTAFFVLMEFIYIAFFFEKDLKKFIFLKPAGTFAVIGLLWLPAIIYFSQQMARVSGMWFQAPTWVSFFSTINYYFFFNYNDLSQMGTYIGIAFIMIMFITIFLYFKLLKDDEEKKFSYFLLLTFILPIAIVLLVNLFLFRVYHHRLFFFYGWAAIVLFARALYYLVVVKGQWSFRYLALKLVAFTLLALFVVIGLANVFNYYTDVPRELQVSSSYLKDNQLCGPVIHESQFSMVPYMYYLSGWCWDNYMYTNLNEIQLNSAGGDVINRDNLIRDVSELEQFNYYYYVSHDRNLVVNGSTVEILMGLEGLQLLKVTND